MKKRFFSLLLAAMILSLSLTATALDAPSLTAKAWVLYEKTSGETLCAQNADERLYPASITKVMTAILALEYGDPESIVTVSASAVDGLYEKGSLVHLSAGEEVGFMDMMHYLLISSGNDAANALAEHIAGSIPEFINRMNLKAEALGCTGTQFTNTHGLHDAEHYTTANDILKIILYAMDIPEFAEIVGKDRYTMPATNKQAAREIWTTNFLLSANAQASYRYAGVTGVKTGTTTAAGRCLAASLPKDDLTFFTVVLGAEVTDKGLNGSFLETKKLLDFGSKQFSMKPLLKSTQLITEIELRLAASRDNVTLMPEEGITALLPSDFSQEDVVLDYETVESVNAPVTRGQILGKLTVIYDGRVRGTVNLVASEDIARSQVLYVIDRIGSFLRSTVFKVVLAAVVLLVAIFILYTVSVNRRRRKRRQKYGGNRYGERVDK